MQSSLLEQELQNKRKSFTLENELQKKVEEMADLINSADNDLEKAIALNNFWRKIHRFASDLNNIEYYVSKQIVLDFFNKHEEHNDYLVLAQEGGTSWKLYAFTIPLCYIKTSSKTVVFYSMDSVNEEFRQLLQKYEKNIEIDKKAIEKINKDFLNKTDFQLFISILKEKGYLSISKIRTAKKNLGEKKIEIEEDIAKNERNKNKINKTLLKMLLFINNITSNLYQNFTKEGWNCELEDIEPHLYYLFNSVDCFEKKDELKGKGLSINEDNSYVKKEKI